MKNFKILIIIAAALTVIFFVITSSLFQEVRGQVPPPGKEQPPQSVIVVNKPVNPVPVLVTKELSFQPWRAHFDLELKEGETSRFVNFPEIPSGKQLIIESVTAQLLVLKEQVPYIQLVISGVYYYISLSNIGSYAPAQYVWMATHDLKLYAEAKDSAKVRVLRAGGTNGVFFAAFSISGYLVDLP